MTSDEEDQRSYKVVVNHEEQYSIWPADVTAPPGWSEVGVEGDRTTCLNRIRELWIDMRPLSLRRALAQS